MYLRVLLENMGEVVAWIREDFSSYLPVESTANRWKQELYFDVPFKVEGEGELLVEKGDVAYWPPGSSLCLFHGVTQPYSPVVRLGFMVGVPDLLAAVEGGTPVRLDVYRDYGDEGKVASALRERGFKAASHTWEEEERVGVALEGPYMRVGAEIYVEDYGFHVQTQPIAFFDNTPPTTSFMEVMSSEISASGVRLDLDEENYMVLTSFFPSLEELVEGLHRMLSTYIYVRRRLNAFYAIRRV